MRLYAERGENSQEKVRYKRDTNPADGVSGVLRAFRRDAAQLRQAFGGAGKGYGSVLTQLQAAGDLYGIASPARSEDELPKDGTAQERIMTNGRRFKTILFRAEVTYRTNGWNKIFFNQCKNYPFTYVDGGPARTEERIYMQGVWASYLAAARMNYGVWASYLAAARSHAVSNYQFAAAVEWFAEE